MNQDLTDQQRKWLETYCDGTISPEEFDLFEKEMESSADFRALARSYLTMDANLSQGAESIVDLSDSWAAAPPVQQKLKAIYIGSLAAIGVVLFFAGMILGGVVKPPAEPLKAVIDVIEHNGVATLKHAIDASWEGNISPDEDEALLPGRYHLTAGSAEIEFYSGTRLLLEAPVDLDLISSNEAFCHSGKLRAFVPPQARGFTVQSPKFELVDLGTEFGLSVDKNGTSNVQVFDGEVELYPPNGDRDSSKLKTLTEGSGIRYSSNGETVDMAPEPDDFLSFQAYQEKTQAAARARFASWQQWSQAVSGDSNIIAHFDFQDEGSVLLDKGQSQNHGAIIGAGWTGGRFPGKRALEFRRPGDRVRLDIPGEFRGLTFSAWVRMDSDAGRTQALFLTDHYQIGRPHWQVSETGTLRFGFRVPPSKGFPDLLNGVGYGSTEIFSSRRIGIWTFVCSTYNLDTNEYVHYLNGRPVSSDAAFVQRVEIEGKGPHKGETGEWKGEYPDALRIGSAEIGNWGAPQRPELTRYSVRNFVGRIDGMTIWKRALDASEISDVYERTRL